MSAQDTAPIVATIIVTHDGETRTIEMTQRDVDTVLAERKMSLVAWAAACIEVDIDCCY